MLATAVDTAPPIVDSHAVSVPYRNADVDSDYTGWSRERLVVLSRTRAWSSEPAITPAPTSNLVHESTSAHVHGIAGSTVFSLTDLVVESHMEPSEQHVRKQEDIARKHLEAARAVTVRIHELRTDARAEGQPISAASEADLLAFLTDCVFTRRPFITLLDNGNLRALWKNAAREQIGIQFRGGGLVQYVFFSRRGGQDFMARVSGRDRLADIGRQIDALNLGRLMTA